MGASLAAKTTLVSSKKCYWGVYSPNASNISEYVQGIKITCSYTSNNMQLWKINIKFANIEKLYEINNGSGTNLFFFLQFHCIWWGNKQLVYIHYAYLCRIWLRRVPPPHSSMIVAALVLVIKWIKTKSFFICSFVLQWTLQVVIWQKRIAHLILDNFGHLLMIWIGVVEDGNK